MKGASTRFARLLGGSLVMTALMALAGCGASTLTPVSAVKQEPVEEAAKVPLQVHNRL